MKKVFALLAATTALTACNTDADKTTALTEEQVKMIIDDYIEQNPGKILESVNTYMTKMQAEQEQMAMQQRFNNPVQVELDEKTPVKGAEDAVITIVEYSDFECPFCQRVTPTLEAVLKRYEGKVKVAYKHLPLSFHANAESAALASMAANEQGQFWEFHDGLFANQQNLNEATYLKIAADLKLDIEKFKTDMASEWAKEKLAKDTAEAANFGIQGTPHFLVNGVPVNGAVPESEFVKVIEKLLNDMNK
jgi:protein-disulfide isomerase